MLSVTIQNQKHKKQIVQVYLPKASSYCYWANDRRPQTEAADSLRKKIPMKLLALLY